MTAASAEEYLTVREVAKQLKVSDQFIYNRRHELGAVRVGTLVRIPRSGLDAYLKAQSAPADAEPAPTKEASTAAKLLSALADAGRPLTLGAWIAAAGLKDSSYVTSVVTQLRKAGKVRLLNKSLWDVNPTSTAA